MSTTTHTSDMAISSPRSTAKQRALTVLCLALAVQFAIAGALKLSGAETMVQMFSDIGRGQWLRYVVGAVEIGAAVGLLAPAAAGLAAVTLIALMLGATVTRVAVLGGPPVAELLFLILAGLIARQYDQQMLPLTRSAMARP